MAVLLECQREVPSEEAKRLVFVEEETAAGIEGRMSSERMLLPLAAVAEAVAVAVAGGLNGKRARRFRENKRERIVRILEVERNPLLELVVRPPVAARLEAERVK